MEINNITGYVYSKVILQCISLKEKSKNGIWNYKGFIDFQVNKLATLYITVRMFMLHLPVQLIHVFHTISTRFPLRWLLSVYAHFRRVIQHNTVSRQFKNIA